MDVTDRERWDRKYRDGEARPLDAPDPFVMSALGHLQGGSGRVPRIESTSESKAPRALDLASGRGRHALELARRGFETEAWDVSPLGLRILEGHAGAAGFTVETREIDLVARPSWSADRHAPIPGGEARFDLVVAVNFLHRPLVQELRRFLVPGGHALVVTFTTEHPAAKPPARYRLEPGEIDSGLPGLETVLCEEAHGRAGLLARLPRASC